MSYTLMNTGEQQAYISDIYEQYTDWLGVAPGMNSAAAGRMLTIKVSSDELWFLRFPLSVFSQHGYGGLSAYKTVEWIVSNKGFVQYGRERARLREEVTDAACLLAGSVVIINTYKEHSDNSLCRQGIHLCYELFTLLQQLEFPDGPVSLRWYLNPSAETLCKLLTDKQTTYFFADFEASSGVWELGDGPSRDWTCQLHPDATTTVGVNAEDPSPRQMFRLEYVSSSLAHIRLMRVFHCNSIFDPFRAAAGGHEPADRHSIVRHLLDAGVQRVEGGITEESLLDYLCALVELFGQSPQFQFMLRFKCLVAGQDYSRLMSRLDSFRLECQERQK